jgi:hypothetical protein
MLRLEDLPDDVDALKTMILASQAELDRLAARAERLDHIIRVLRRAQFGRSSERISEDQISLALEDAETSFAREDAGAEQRSAITRNKAVKERRAIAAIYPGICRARRSSSSRKARPAPAAAPFMSSARTSRSGSTGSRRSCASPSPAGRNMPAALAPTASGRPAPARLIEGGLPTEAMVADVLISKYADHLPLYRQSQILAREASISTAPCRLTGTDRREAPRRPACARLSAGRTSGAAFMTSPKAAMRRLPMKRFSASAVSMRAKPRSAANRRNGARQHARSGASRSRMI